MPPVDLRQEVWHFNLDTQKDCAGLAVSNMDSAVACQNDTNGTLAGPSTETAPEKGGEQHSTEQNGVTLPAASQKSQEPQSKQQDEKSSPVVSLGSIDSPVPDGSSPTAKTSDATEDAATEKKEKASKPSLVDGLSVWDFPVGTLDMSKFVSDSLRRGSDAKVVLSNTTSNKIETSSSTHPSTPPRPTRAARTKRIRYDEKALEDNIIGAEEQNERPPFGSPRSRRRINEDPTFEKKIHPKATGIEFDTRFLRFATAPDGSKMEEKLVWSADKVIEVISHDSREACIEKIPDLPKRCKKSLSRVGPMYQARIPKKGEAGKDDIDWDEPPGYDKIWDPQLAAAAEMEGQNITNYLQTESKIDLCKSEFLMKLLHENDYNVERARVDMNKVQRFRGTFKLNKQRELEDDWCAHKDGKCMYADDEHTLVVCDGCGRAYHLECVRLDAVPSGRWYCPVCHQHFTGLSSTLPGVKTRKAKAYLRTSATLSKPK